MIWLGLCQVKHKYRNNVLFATQFCVCRICIVLKSIVSQAYRPVLSPDKPLPILLSITATYTFQYWCILVFIHYILCIIQFHNWLVLHSKFLNKYIRRLIRRTQIFLTYKEIYSNINYKTVISKIIPVSIFHLKLNSAMLLVLIWSQVKDIESQ
jgi:hypothetical protein